MCGCQLDHVINECDRLFLSIYQSQTQGGQFQQVTVVMIVFEIFLLVGLILLSDSLRAEEQYLRSSAASKLKYYHQSRL